MKNAFTNFAFGLVLAAYAAPSLAQMGNAGNSPRETLDNPANPRDNGSVIAGHGWFHGRQAARIR